MIAALCPVNSNSLRAIETRLHNLLKCFDTVDWLTEGHLVCKKFLHQHSLKESAGNRWETGTSII